MENEIVACKLTKEPLDTHRPQPTQGAGKLERRDSADTEHIHWPGVVAEHQRATLHWAPPQALFAEGKLPIVEGQPYIRVQQLNLIDGGERRRRWNSQRVCVIDR